MMCCEVKGYIFLKLTGKFVIKPNWPVADLMRDL